MNTNVPDMSIARGAPLGMPAHGGTFFSSTPQSAGLVAVTPPPQLQPGMRPDPSRKQKALGLIPAQPGSLHPMISREGPKVRLDPKDVSRARAELRRAKVRAQAAEATLIATAGEGLQNAGTDEYKTKLLASRDANDLVAALTRKLAEMEAASASRPIRVTLATVREPGEMVDEIANGETAFVCLHDGCKGDRWADEAAMRRAHPTDQEMRQRQQTHVYALLCEAPIDPLDPEGEKIGYVAPVGSDGTTIRAAAAKVEDEARTSEEVADLRAEIAELRALLQDAMVPKKPSK
jgi:hypothetical protein